MTTAGPSDADRWSRINDLFHRALDLPGDARAAFVARESGGDGTLRDEVLSLLGAHARAADFIERPPDTPSLFDSGDPPDALVGQMLGHYRIARVLGRGGMGVVYLADDTRLGRAVALKAVAPRFTDDPTRRERLRREARAAAVLHHPGIATVFALEEFGDQLYIAGEYVPGVTLRDELARGPLDVRRALDTMRALTGAVSAAHDRGIVHRDLKPENVIRTPSGDVKVLDFGLARLPEMPAAMLQLTADGAVLGTPAYMSPEQIRGGEVDGRSDVFSLGVILYELVTGVHPFHGDDATSMIARILEQEPAALTTAVVPGLAGPARDALERIIRTCLQKPVGARYPTARALGAALDAVSAALDGRRVDLPAPLPSDATAHAAGRGAALWWWQFHQAAASASYALLLIPLWLVREHVAGETATIVFLLGLVAALTAIVLRLHLWFAVRSYPSEWAAQRSHSEPWIRRADVAFALALASAGLITRAPRLSLAIILIAAAVAVLISSAIIEPATTRAVVKDRA